MIRSHKGIYIFVSLSMLLLILDSRQVIASASQGIDLCIRTAIPSLVPFFVLSGILVPGISKIRIPALGKALKVPSGWESVFLLSCVGGYPVGAQCIAQGYGSGQLKKDQAQRMLGFCNNCGPSFLFGVVASFFPNPGHVIKIMGISILSAIIAGRIWPGGTDTATDPPQIPPASLLQAVRQAIHSMAGVCAWIILGKIGVHYMDLLLLRYIPEAMGTVLTGILELTNGCFRLGQISDDTIRAYASAFMTSFGGLCVAMQVSSICADAGLSTHSYLPQKFLQASIACILAWIISQQTLFIISLIWIGCWILFKTAVAFRNKMMYNRGCKGGFHYAVPKEN